MTRGKFVRAQQRKVFVVVSRRARPTLFPIQNFPHTQSPATHSPPKSPTVHRPLQKSSPYKISSSQNNPDLSVSLITNTFSRPLPCFQVPSYASPSVCTESASFERLSFCCRDHVLMFLGFGHLVQHHDSGCSPILSPTRTSYSAGSPRLHVPCKLCSVTWSRSTHNLSVFLESSPTLRPRLQSRTLSYCS